LEELLHKIEGSDLVRVETLTESEGGRPCRLVTLSPER